jgi:hypothetical protein
MGLNLSNQQIAQELDKDLDDVYQMTSLLRSGIVAAKPEVTLSGEVECDEVYITAGHKGSPEAVKKKVATEGAIALKGFRAELPLKKKNHRFSG